MRLTKLGGLMLISTVVAVSVAGEDAPHAALESQLTDTNSRLQAALSKRDFTTALADAEALCALLREITKPSTSAVAALATKAPRLDATLQGQVIQGIVWSTWSLQAQLGKEDYITLSSAESARRFDEWVQEQPHAADRHLFRQFKEQISMGIQEFVCLGGAGDGFLWQKKDPWTPPAAFFQVDGELGVLFTSYVSDTTFNTLRSEPRERAWKVVNQHALQGLARASRDFSGQPIRRVGIAISYGSKDFSSNSVVSSRGETVVIIVPTDVGKRFGEQKITDQELLDASEIFLADRDNPLSFKKVRLRAE